MMKKTLFVLFTAAMLFVTFACKQPSDPAKYTGKGAQQNMASPKSVTIPINIIKAADGTVNKGFLTRSIREEILYTVKQATLGSNAVVETEEKEKTNYLDWDLSVGRTEEEALSETLIVNHVTTKGSLADVSALTNVQITYAEIKKWFGRELQVGDEFWLGFRCSNQDGKELARMAHHIKAGNPTKLDKVELKYGFEGWYIKATLGDGTNDASYPTATANFFIGADEKSGEKVNEKPINGHVVKDTKLKTLFYCKLPDGKVVEGQPYHIKVHFNDVEFGGDDGISSFESADVIYAKDADSAWNFQAQKLDTTPAGINENGQTALAKARGAVELADADIDVVWHSMEDAAMIFAKAEDGRARLANQVYKVRLAKTEADLDKADPNQYTVHPKIVVANKPDRYKVNLNGLQYGQVYFLRVDYSYDILKANSKERKTVPSPVVQFTTVNGLVSPLFTMDSGRKIPTTLGVYPASLMTDGTFVTSGGNPSNALQLNATQKVESAAVKRYKTASLTFDQIFPSNIDSVVAHTIGAAQLFDAKDHKYPGDEKYAFDATYGAKVIWTVKTGTNVEARLVYLPPYLTSDKDDYTVAGKWTVTQGKLVLVVKGDAATKSDTVKVTNAYLTSKTASTGGLDLNNTYTDAMVAGKVQVVLDANAGWLAPYNVAVNFKAGEIEAKMGDKSTTVKITSLVEQYNGYEKFTLESAQAGLLVDNVQYKVVDGKIADYTRRVR